MPKPHHAWLDHDRALAVAPSMHSRTLHYFNRGLCAMRLGMLEEAHEDGTGGWPIRPVAWFRQWQRERAEARQEAERTAAAATARKKADERNRRAAEEARQRIGSADRGDGSIASVRTYLQEEPRYPTT